jgi:hypothetical protein
MAPSALTAAKERAPVIIQLRSIGRAQPEDLAAILPTLSEAAAAVDLDHSRLAVALDWVKYEGILVAQDLFAGDVGQYASFRGPGKLEGSIVNWINAPIFQLLGERSGFEVTVEPFAYREGSNISVLSARHRDAYRRPSGDHDDHELATEARDAGFGAVVA